MKITKVKIVRTLKEQGWNLGAVDVMVVDAVLTIIDAELKAHKGISIK